MTNEELQQLYAQTGTKQSDFKKWAKSHGVVIADSVTSRHYNGNVSIPKAYVLAYKWFFSFHGA